MSIHIGEKLIGIAALYVFAYGAAVGICITKYIDERKQQRA